jgi:hypothetical protein
VPAAPDPVRGTHKGQMSAFSARDDAYSRQLHKPDKSSSTGRSRAVGEQPLQIWVESILARFARPADSCKLGLTYRSLCRAWLTQRRTAERGKSTLLYTHATSDLHARLRRELRSLMCRYRRSAEGVRNMNPAGYLRLGGLPIW